MNRIKTPTRAKFTMRRIGLAPEYSPRETRHNAASALETLARAVEAAKVGAHVHPTPRVLAAWRDAEKVCGPLTLSGTPREEPDALALVESEVSR
jgi:hypothetical protein